MDISQKTTTELKAIAFDLIKEVERIQINLQIVDKALQKRQEEATEEDKDKTEEPQNPAEEE